MRMKSTQQFLYGSNIASAIQRDKHAPKAVPYLDIGKICSFTKCNSFGRSAAEREHLRHGRFFPEIVAARVRVISVTFASYANPPLVDIRAGVGVETTNCAESSASCAVPTMVVFDAAPLFCFSTRTRAAPPTV